jgi:hypothetical protein
LTSAERFPRWSPAFGFKEPSVLSSAKSPYKFVNVLLVYVTPFFRDPQRSRWKEFSQWRIWENPFLTANAFLTADPFLPADLCPHDCSDFPMTPK